MTSPPDPNTIRTTREAAGLTQRQLAARLGVARNTIQSWENDRRHPTGLYADALEDWMRAVREEWLHEGNDR